MVISECDNRTLKQMVHEDDRVDSLEHLDRQTAPGELSAFRTADW